jgi:hypothetical protein
VGSELSNDEAVAKKKKIPAGSIPLMMAGDLLLARCTNREYSQVFRRYEAILETFANMERDERLMNYKFLVALMLTSHAKKLQSVQERKALFDLKNQLYFNVANSKVNRRKIAFRYLVSKNFRVVEFCEVCKTKNAAEGLERHKWKFCRNCNVDRKFYNVLQMSHHFENGTMALYLSNDLVHLVENLKVTQKGKLENAKEEGRFDKFHYNVKNLDIFTLDSVKKVQARLLQI